MSLKPEPRPGRGAAGSLFVVCAAAAALGLGLDWTAVEPSGFWISTRFGAGAAIGAGGAMFAVFAALIARLLLTRRRKPDAGSDA